MEYYETQRLSDNVYLIFERYAPDNAFTLGVIVGGDRAALIDSGMGMFGDTLKDVVASITDKPVINILTHGHPDHIAGSVLFDEVYMNQRDEGQIPRLNPKMRLKDTAHFSHDDETVMQYAKEHCIDCGGFQYKDIDAGDTVDLGGGTVLKIFALPGHSAGSIAIFDEKDAVCFVGDAFNTSLPCSSLTDLGQFQKMADAIGTLIDNVPEEIPLYGGHWEKPISWQLVKDERMTAQELAERKTDGDEDVYLPISPVPYQKRHTHGLYGISYNPAILA